MSIEVMNQVWRHSRATGRARLTLLAIADHQGEIGAWPSVETLAKSVNASTRSVQRDIADLVAIGELRVEFQNAPTKSQYKSNLYWVTVAGVTDSTSGVTDEATRGDNVGVQNLNRTLNKNIKEQEKKQFEEFWKEYPVKNDRPKAFKAFQKALMRASFEDILAGAIAYRNDPTREAKFTRWPATWLNNDSWENAATKPEVREAIEKRREREQQATARMLAEQEKARTASTPPPKCEHGESIARCKRCL